MLKFETKACPLMLFSGCSILSSAFTYKWDKYKNKKVLHTSEMANY